MNTQVNVFWPKTPENLLTIAKMWDSFDPLKIVTIPKGAVIESVLNQGKSTNTMMHIVTYSYNATGDSTDAIDHSQRE